MCVFVFVLYVYVYMYMWMYMYKLGHHGSAKGLASVQYQATICTSAG